MEDGAAARFLLHVDFTGLEPTACWVWTGATIGKGYGQFRWVWAGRRTWTAHRASYLMFVGEVPEGLELDHLCRNRRCVRPSHLEPVTHVENLRRASLARQSAGVCINGHNLDEVGGYPDTRGSLRCMECARVSRRKYEAKRRAEASV